MQSVHNRFMVDVVLALDARNGIYVQAPDLPSRLLNIIWSPIDRRTLFKSLSWREFMKKTVLGEEANGRTLFSRLLEAKDPETGQSLSHQELMAEAQFLLVAGLYRLITANWLSNKIWRRFCRLRNDCYHVIIVVLLYSQQPIRLPNLSIRDPLQFLVPLTNPNRPRALLLHLPLGLHPRNTAHVTRRRRRHVAWGRSRWCYSRQSIHPRRLRRWYLHLRNSPQRYLLPRPFLLYPRALASR